MAIELSKEQRRFFRDQLRAARAAALLDSEGFRPIVTAFERLGSILTPDGRNLGQFRDSLMAVANRARGAPAPEGERGVYTPLDVLFTVVREGRNDAVHQGAHARHLVRHCIELALHIEEGLMADSTSVADFMVRTPVCAEPWQPIGLARQQMLTNSFSYLPLWYHERWHLLSDYAVATFLSKSDSPAKALREPIGSACARNALILDRAVVVDPIMEVREALQVCEGRPVLVLEEGRLLGIATPFDLL